MNNNPTTIASKLMIELRKCEVDVHMKTLKGGYADVVIIGDELYDYVLPEIKERLQNEFGDKIILKPKMYNPFIRYIWFGDNEHFPEITLKLELDTPIQDQERQIKLKREYLIKDIDHEYIQDLFTADTLSNNNISTDNKNKIDNTT